MIVVSDTSPLTNLAAVGYFHLLQEIYSQIVIAQAVYDEIVTSRSGNPGATEIQQATWIEIKSATNQALVTALKLELDNLSVKHHRCSGLILYNRNYHP